MKTLVTTKAWGVVCLVFFGTLFLNAQNRAIDGRNNNLNHPEWGSATSALQIVTPLAYKDGFSSPSGDDRPNPRTVSNKLFAQAEPLHNSMRLSDFVWVFGQFIDHDVTFVLDGHEEFMIDVPQGDPMFDPFRTGEILIPMARSEIIEGTGTAINNPRRHPNAITAFIDGSGVYGSDEERANWLRSFKNGKLRTSAGNYLPYNTITGELESPLSSNAPLMDNFPIDPDEKLFVAGDARANENPVLLSLHTLFMREHNRLCDELSQKYPDWNDEQIYQHARKTVGGLIQSIVYDEWGPTIGLDFDAYTGYNKQINPSIMNVFSAAAYRIGHTLLSGTLVRMDHDGKEMEEGNVLLRDAFFNSSILVKSGGLDPFFMGMASQMHQDFDSKVVDDIRNFLFGAPGSGGIDLAATNIQRARERGLADFNTIRDAFGLQRYQSFSQINSSPTVYGNLIDIYDNINLIDPWVGMTAEARVDGSLFGETVKKILETQFSALRDGDRFYYESDPILSTEDKAFIKASTFADIIERNTQIAIMQDNVFRVVTTETNDEECLTMDVYGNIFTENGTRLGDVDIDIISNESRQQGITADGQGYFDYYELDDCSAHVIRPSKQSSLVDYASVKDLIALIKHVQGAHRMNSPYKIIAADLDGSRTVDDNDIQIYMEILRGNFTKFPIGKTWRFVPKDYKFSDPRDPFKDEFPEYIYMDKHEHPASFDFVAMQIGNFEGDISTSSVIQQRSEADLNEIVATLNGKGDVELYQNYPNPFSHTTIIPFSLPHTAEVTLTLLDASGRVLKSIEQTFDAGQNELIVHRKDLPSTGVIYYRLSSDHFLVSKKMVILE